jgi:predicted DNA-binding WGR domain protein
MTITYDRGDKIVTIPLTYIYVGAGVTLKPPGGDFTQNYLKDPRIAIHCFGHYRAWSVGFEWVVALLHPELQCFCNHVVYDDRQTALTVLLDLQNQPSLPRDYETTLVWNRVGDGNKATYEHFRTHEAAQEALERLNQERKLEFVYQPLLIPYQVPYRVGNRFPEYIQWRPVSWDLEKSRKHCQFVTPI